MVTPIPFPAQSMLLRRRRKLPLRHQFFQSKCSLS
jgi:hypothetical protein